MAAKTIVFIHGMFMTPLCWEPWAQYFREQGYTCLTPPWPGRDQPVANLVAAHPNPQVGQLTLRQVLAYYADLVQKLPEKPVLIGHSMGGLMTQLLIQRGLAAAGIAIHSGPPLGLLSLEPSFLKSALPILFAPPTQPYYMTFEHFQYTFVHTLPLAEQKAAYETYVVPESRQVAWQMISNSVSWLDFNKPHAPLLLTAGSADRIIPASLNRNNAARYGKNAPVDFKEFPGRTHFVLGQPGWEEVATYGAAWLKTKGL
jgi:pimeloyl-ACP methyl ester carboxylesterase